MIMIMKFEYRLRSGNTTHIMHPIVLQRPAQGSLTSDRKALTKIFWIKAGIIAAEHSDHINEITLKSVESIPDAEQVTTVNAEIKKATGEV